MLSSSLSLQLSSITFRQHAVIVVISIVVCIIAMSIYWFITLTSWSEVKKLDRDIVRGSLCRVIMTNA